MNISFQPLTAGRWNDFEKLFGPRGACGGCWCMWWRLSAADFEALKGKGNRQLMKSQIEAGEIPGILAYIDGEPAAWCSIAPRSSFPRLAKSRILQPVDDQPVWSVVCFFVAKEHRRKGLTVRLLQAASDYATQHGARIVEGYPKELSQGPLPDAFVYTGLAPAFEQAGFVEVLRRSESRPIMRRFIEEEL